MQFNRLPRQQQDLARQQWSFAWASGKDATMQVDLGYRGSFHCLIKSGYAILNFTAKQMVAFFTVHQNAKKPVTDKAWSVSYCTAYTCGFFNAGVTSCTKTAPIPFMVVFARSNYMLSYRE